MGRIADDDPGLAAYLDRVERYPLLDREAELHLARRWREAGDRRAGDELITANLRFVVRIALRYRGYGLRVADLVEEGNLGLLEALRRFEPERHLRFMTYAGYWARAYILAHVLKQRSLVGVGTGPLQSRLFFGLARERARLVAATRSRCGSRRASAPRPSASARSARASTPRTPRSTRPPTATAIAAARSSAIC